MNKPASRIAQVMLGQLPPPQYLLDYLIAPVVVIAFLLGWESIVWLADTPVYLVPAPSVVLRELWHNVDALLWAGAVTSGHALAGLALGGGIGLGLAMALSFWPAMERGVLSLAILIKATPLIAIAPILTIWLGFGAAPKVIVTALLTFFPVLVNALSGFRATNAAILDVMTSLAASPWEIFVHVRWPGARPYLFAALKVVAPLAMVGAVIAEWMGASSGLGRIMWLAYTNLDMPALFAAVFILTALSIMLYQAILWLEQKFLFW